MGIEKRIHEDRRREPRRASSMQQTLEASNSASSTTVRQCSVSSSLVWWRWGVWQPPTSCSSRITSTVWPPPPPPLCQFHNVCTVQPKDYLTWAARGRCWIRISILEQVSRGCIRRRRQTVGSGRTTSSGGQGLECVGHLTHRVQHYLAPKYVGSIQWVSTSIFTFWVLGQWVDPQFLHPYFLPTTPFLQKAKENSHTGTDKN